MSFWPTFFLLLLPFIATAQSDSLLAEQLTEKAAKLMADGKTDSAILLHHQAIKTFRQADLPYHALRSYRVVYASWESKNKPLQLLDTLQAALAACPRPANVRPEHSRHANFLLYIGYVYQNYLKDYYSARFYYELAYTIFIEKLGENEDVVAKFIYHQLGNIYTRLGDYERAKFLLKRKLKYGNDHAIPQMNNALADLAIVYFSEGKLDSAKAAIDKGLALANIKPDFQFSLLQHTASYWLKKTKPTKALEALELARPLLDSIKQQSKSKANHFFLASWYDMMAQAQIALGDTARALAFYHQSIATRMEGQQGNANGRELAKTYIAHGKALMEVGQLNEALSQCQLALQAVLPDFEPSGGENPAPNLLTAENAIIEALELKAACLERMGRLEEALESYALIPSVETKLRKTFHYQNSSLMLLAEKRARLEKAVSLARKLYDRTGDDRYLGQAFHFTELARGELLLESIAANAAAANLPPELRQLEQELASRIAWCEQEAASKKRSTPLADLDSLRFNYLGQFAKLQDSLNHAFPHYLRSKQEVAIAHATDLASLLRKGQVLASFFAEGDSVLHVFFFDENGRSHWRSTAVPPGFFNDAFSLSNNIGNENQLPSAIGKMADDAHYLYKVLLEPELESVSEAASSIVVVPDGVLSQLPFEALLQKPATTDANFADMDFLLKKLAVSSLPSATVGKLFQQRSAQAGATATFAGFAPKYDEKAANGIAARSRDQGDSLLADLMRGGLYDLPGAREEVRLVASIMGGDNFSGELANKPNFMKEAPHYDILHLAMHALPDRKNPALSRLIFTQAVGDEERDFNLYANELGSLSLQADLAVLSACNSGTGKWHQGEGVFSLARAFHLAGVPNVVMSLWRLPDSTTPEIMVAFYKNLKSGMAKDEALRQAKLDYLTGKKGAGLAKTHPFFWAGLVLSGN